MKDNNKLYFTLNKEKKQVKFTEKDSLDDFISFPSKE